MLQPSEREYVASLYRDKSSEDLIDEEKRVIDEALAAGRIVLLPWQHAPSRVWRHVPLPACTRTTTSTWVRAATT